MATARTRRRFATALVAGLWLGAALFALAALRPALARALAMQQELDEALTVMKGRLERELVPSEGVIGHYEALKKAMIREAESCAYEYLRHSECLGKDLLQSWRMDPYEVEMNFRAVKKRLADKAGHPDFLDLGPLGVWDQEASPGSRRPTQQDLAALEKRTCIASVLVDILAHEPGTVIDLMKITDPLQPRKAPPAPQVLDRGPLHGHHEAASGEHPAQRTGQGAGGAGRPRLRLLPGEGPVPVNELCKGPEPV